jgi:GAF domain-containing protein
MARENILKSNDEKVINLIITKTVEELSICLIKGFENPRSSAFLFYDDPSPAVQLTYIFNKLNIIEQDKFRNAIIQAIEKWDLAATAYDLLVLEDLVILASYTSAYSAIEILASILSQWSKDFENNVQEKYQKTVGKIIAVLSGFAKSKAEITGQKRIVRLFKKLLIEDFDPRYAAQLFLGLCICDPKGYPEFLSQFLKSYKENPDLYNLEAVIKTFVDIVPSDILEEKLSGLGLIYQDELRKFSCTKFLFEGKIYSFQKAIERSDEASRTRGELMSLDDKDILIQKSLQIVRKELLAQVASIYLFSKEGYLYRTGIEGTNSEGDLIEEWFEEKKYYVGNNKLELNQEIASQFYYEGFIVAAARNETGASQLINYFDSEQLPQELWGKYTKELGDLTCGISIPLNGRNRTYGVLVVINKVDEKTKKPRINSCAFSSDDYFRLAEIRSIIEVAISSFHKGQQEKFENDLANLLVEASSPKIVYKKVVRQLTSKHTDFKACVLRLKNERGELEVIEKYIAADNEEELEKLLKDRVDELIKPDEVLNGSIKERFEHIAFPINEATINKFSVNEKWVRENKFKHFIRFPLLSGEKLVGTLSLYIAYNYTLYPSYIAFLKRSTTLLASFILRVTSSAEISHVHKDIKKLLKKDIFTNKDLLKEEGNSMQQAFRVQQREITQQLENLDVNLISIGSVGNVENVETYSTYD